MKKTITIIDTFGFLFRSYFALPPLKSQTGFPTGMLTGFMNLIANIGKDFDTDYLVFALDSKGDTFRHKLYSEYKAHRPDVPDDLLAQLPIAISWIEKMGFAGVAKDGYEADDIVASLATEARAKGFKVIIVSHDKDLYQLIEDRIEMFDPLKKKIITDDICFEKYGVYPDQFTNYQALLGDSADNIPGVKGVGAKTAMALIQQFGDLDNIYKNIENIEKPRWQKLLNEGKELAYLSHSLVVLDKKACSLDKIENYALPSENPILKIASTLQEYDMHRVIDKVHKEGTSYKTTTPLDYKYEAPKELVQLKGNFILLNDKKELIDLVSCISSASIVALDTETTSTNSAIAKIVGFSFCFDEDNAYYVPMNHKYLGAPEQISFDTAKEAIEILNTKKLVLQNFKYDYDVVKNNFNIELKLHADTMIMAWLLDSGSFVGLDKLAKKYLNHNMIAFKDVVKKGETFDSIDIDEACKYASEDAWMTYKIYQLEDGLINKEEQIKNIATNIEYPFVYVLSYMQNNGIKVDVDFLKALLNQSKVKLDLLVEEIHSMCDAKFNINSTKQLGEILFDKLQLPPSKKTKTGYSTNEAVLLQLVGKHDVITKILEYRESFKLHSTYIEPLLQYGLNDPQNIIHTSFLQTGTATGRLSSKDPNLQNIPVRSEAGRNIRKAFVAQNGYKLIGIDYSQIELRLLAHFSQDNTLLEAFNNGDDIHHQTAVKLFGQDDATNKRHIAKTINFGLIYGMGAKKLAQTLDIETKEAKSYIDSYFTHFSTVKEYLLSIEEDAMSKGFVSTLLGRHRHFNFGGANGMLKASFLREAVNTVFQGSASDLIKLSMIKIYEQYKDDKNIQMLLQIHDELIFQVKVDEVEHYANEIKSIMTNIFTLKVPLDVSISIGDNWSELK